METETERQVDQRGGHDYFLLPACFLREEESGYHLLFRVGELSISSDEQIEGLVRDFYSRLFSEDDHFRSRVANDLLPFFSRGEGCYLSEFHRGGGSLGSLLSCRQGW